MKAAFEKKKLIHLIRFLLFQMLRRSVATQVSVSTQTNGTNTEDTCTYERSLTQIFTKLKNELVDLHTHLERRPIAC